MVKSLEGLLIPQLVAVLKILLRTRPEVRITSKSGSEEEEEGEGGGGGGGGGGTGKVGLRRPASWEIFAGGVRDSWEQVSVVGSGGVEQGRMEGVAAAAAAGDLGGERGKSQRKKEKKRRIRGWWRSSKDEPSPQQQPLSIFKSFSQKEFMPELTLDSSASSSSSSSSQNKKNPPFQPHLRGGGGGGGGDEASTNDNNKEAKSTPFPFIRSARVYLRRSDGCLNDAERVPRTLFWLAGGRVSPRMKAPTAGELRRRRQVERVNRREVGFVGTLFGVRRACKVECDGVGGGGGEIGVDGGNGTGEGDGG